MDENQGCKRPSTFQMKRYEPTTCIEKYSFMLIRPPRFLYNDNIINPKRKYNNRFEHTVYYLPFPLSVYTPLRPRYIILYLHGNSSSRYEGYSQLARLPNNVGLACFDFAGCGNRVEQEYISLGKREAADVDIAVTFLQSKQFKVVVWGRSMGAVSALLSSKTDILIVDSPFSNLKAVSKQIALKAVPCICLCFFHCLFPCIFKAVSSDVYAKTGVDTDELNILQTINKDTKRKIMFLAAKEDKMIHHSHTQMLYDQYQGEHKRIVLFDGTHHSDRPSEIMSQAYDFIEKALFGEGTVLQKRVEKGEKKEESQLGEIRSFSLLKDQKAEKQSQMRKSVKMMQISSKVAEGGQSEIMERIKQSQANQSEKYH